MKFHLDFEVPKLQGGFSYESRIMMIGSCFSEHIASRLAERRFNIISNPEGIMFNPSSIANCLTDCLNKKRYKEEDLFLLNGVFNSWSHHSSFSGINKAETLEKINKSIAQASSFMLEADFLILTFGSAWAYQILHPHCATKEGYVVANNHKAPSDWFRKIRIEKDQIVTSYKPIFTRLWEANKKLKIILTVSPVRHLSDDLVNNNLSKSILISSVHELRETYEENVFYFPSYELVIDDLRDYRFFEEDLVHPNKMAIEYVWEHFLNSCANSKTIEPLREVEALGKAMKHRSFHAGSKEYQQFLLKSLEKANRLKLKYPFINLEEEINFFSQH